MKVIIYSVTLLSMYCVGQTTVPFLPRAGVFNTPYNPANQAVYNGPLIPIVDYSNEINVDGSYRYSFATADGKQAEESGYLKDVAVNSDGEPIGIQVVQGSYSYTAPDGTPVQVSYIADENGFQPQTVKIPTLDRPLVNPALPLSARVNPFTAAAFRNPYAATPLLARFNRQFANNGYNAIAAPIENQNAK